MRCWKVRRCLSLYIDGELDTPARVKLEKHSRSCQRCLKALSELQEYYDLITMVDTIVPPEEIWPRIKHEIEGQKIKYPSLTLRALRPLAVASILLLVILSGTMIRRFSAQIPLPERSKVVSPTVKRIAIDGLLIPVSEALYDRIEALNEALKGMEAPYEACPTGNEPYRGG